MRSLALSSGGVLAEYLNDDLMRKLIGGVMLRLATSIFAIILFVFVPTKSSSAMIVDRGGGYICNVGTTSSGGQTWEYWDCFYIEDSGGGGGGGGGGGEPPNGGGGGGAGAYTVPRGANNPENAMCSSDGVARYLSARQDFLTWKASTRPTQIYGKGEILKISYLGGGYEKYVWIHGKVASPTAPAESMLARVPGSLVCP